MPVQYLLIVFLNTMPKTETPQTLQQQAIDWILRLESAACTPTEREAFQAWLAKGEDRQRIYRQLVGRWNKLDRFKGQDFQVRREALSYRAPRKTARRIAELAVAASLLLGLGLATFSERGWYGHRASYITARGGHRTIQLADGSSLELGTDTELHLRVNRWRRSVELIKGEAFFSVAHDEKRPFEVKAGNGTIVDIGTQFDVRLQNDSVAVAVLEGTVRVETNDSREINANQFLTYDPQGEFLESTSEDLDKLTAWRHGQLVFENRRLDEVLAELERYHDIHLSLADPALAKLKVSGTFHTDNLDGALNIISMTLPIDIRHPDPQQILLVKRLNNGQGRQGNAFLH